MPTKHSASAPKALSTFTHTKRLTMTISFTSKLASDKLSHNEAIIVAIHKDGKLSASAQAIDTASKGALSALIKSGDVLGNEGKVAAVAQPNGDFKRVITIGTGATAKDAISRKKFREITLAALKAVKATPATEFTVALGELNVDGSDATWKTQQIALLAGDVAYSFIETKGKATQAAAKSKGFSKIALIVNKDEAKAVNAMLAHASGVIGGVNLTKDLGNLPGNICTPTYLADTAKKLGKEFGFKVEVLEEKEMKKLGMNTLLSVSRGSDEPPKFIVMHYNGGKKGDRPLALVGKGVTFDTGGISLKPGEGMDEMKFDMCGAGTVLGVMKATATLKLNVNVIGVIAAVENMPSGRATKPGDIVTSMSGQTVEILNTDAEGRLILCDALTYVERFNPKKVVDIATLTGAIIIGLGNFTTGIYANNDALAKELVDAGETCYDRGWHMPMFDEYNDMLKSNFADIPNITGSRAAGSITAACFLSRFTKTMNWAHMDIAGVANKSGAEKGATGRPVPLLTGWIAKHA
jgi:leucyl aminopeptidase